MIRRLRDLAIIDIRPGEVRAFLPFSARLILDDLPAVERRWDAERDCWIMPLAAVGQLVRDLNAAGYAVDVWTGDVMKTYQQGRADVGRAA